MLSGTGDPARRLSDLIVALGEEGTGGGATVLARTAAAVARAGAAVTAVARERRRKRTVVEGAGARRSLEAVRGYHKWQPSPAQVNFPKIMQVAHAQVKSQDSSLR